MFRIYRRNDTVQAVFDFILFRIWDTLRSGSRLLIPSSNLFFCQSRLSAVWAAHLRPLLWNYDGISTIRTAIEVSLSALKQSNHRNRDNILTSLADSRTKLEFKGRKLFTFCIFQDLLLILLRKFLQNTFQHGMPQAVPQTDLPCCIAGRACKFIDSTHFPSPFFYPETSRNTVECYALNNWRTEFGC